MALAPTTTLPLYPTHTLSVPLTTPWTAAPSCSAALPRVSQGTCVGTVCAADQYPNTGLVSGWINWPWRTDLQHFTATECMPPGYNDRYLFAYVAPSGCPKGYVTGAVSSWPYDMGMSVVTCCPSSHSLSYYPTAFTDAYGSTTWPAACTTIRTLTSGERYLGVAVGYNTQAVQTVASDITITTITAYYTESVIRTSTVSVSAVQVVINQPYIQVLVPKGGAAAASPTSTSSPSSSSGKNKFSVFGLPFVLSIVATAGIGIGGLVFLCCGYSILSRCCRSSSRSSRTYYVPPGPPAPAAPYIPATTVSAYNNNNNPPGGTCSHSRSHLCSYKLSYETLCCACKDSRPPSPALTIHSRTATYCYACQTHFRSLPLAQLPPAWRTEADVDVDALVEEILEQRKCRHGVVAVVCSRTAGDSKTCCACIDPRAAPPVLTQQQRADGYCEGCKDFFADLPAQECPEEWRLGEVDCPHGFARAKECRNPEKGRWEAACCVCKDQRQGTMPRGDRTALYCGACKGFWDAVEVEKLPAAWGIRCGHEDRYLRCRGGCAAGGQCCACVDGRRGPMAKGERVAAGYCEDCRGYWSGVADADCPKAWLLKCRHGRANAWEVQSMQNTALGRRPLAATGTCCCACRDTRTELMTKIERTKNYCRDCRSFWSSRGDHELPPEWQLSCRHGGMGTWCLATGPSNLSQCCACLDTGRPKNMTKYARLKTYCTNCQNAWWGTPDQQCPPEWNLMAPRTDCKHAIALECMMSPAGGETWCCACKDGRKFLNLPDRLATFCVPCGTHWSNKAAGGDLPVGWTVTAKDIPIVYQKEGCRPRKPKVEYPSESQDKYRQQFDQGPRYGPPKFLDGSTPMAAVELPANPAISKPRTPTANNGSSVFDGADVINASITPASPLGADPVYTGYQEKGLQRGAPRFAVAPDPACLSDDIGVPLSEKPAAVAPSIPKKTATGKAPSRAEKQRRKEQAGLCKGREPVFQVPPD